MTALAKLQAILHKLLRLEETADLDFGVYRLVNLKREYLTRYLEEQLPQRVQAVLEQTGQSDRDAKDAELARARAAAIENLEDDAIDADGNLKQEYQNTRPGKAYLSAQQDALHILPAAKMHEEIYDHLATFFSRYECGGGDIVPRRRHSASNRYAIPHAGEEVLLHWANRGQHYIKSSAYHPSIAVRLKGQRFVFRITDVRDIPRGNNMDSGRFLLPQISDIGQEANGDILIPFTFRALDEEEQDKYSGLANGGNGNGGKVQSGILEEALAEITKTAGKNTALAPLVSDTEGESDFLRYARRFVRRNNEDFFIHQDLRGFLERELDFYLKNEMLSAEELSQISGGAVASRMVAFRIVRELGRDIINELAQWEDLQKALWEKPKFVLQTEYCATLGHIPNLEKSKLLDAIAKNEKQWEEWKQLGLSGGVEKLFSKRGKHEKRIAWLQENPSLPVDTVHFPSEFKDRLLEQFSDIDDATDGVLIHGENWQALNLMQEVYSGRVKCIYIDPPFNTGPSEILYKNGLKHSSWLSLMEGRLALSAPFLSEDGMIEVAIDDAELDGLLLLMKSIFGTDNCIGTISVMHNPRGRADAQHLSPAHEYLICYAKSYSRLTTNQLVQSESRIVDKYPHTDHISRYRELPFRRSGSNSSREARPNMFYSIFYNPSTKEFSPTRRGDSYVEIFPIDSNGNERVWRWERSKFEELAETEFVAKLSKLGEYTVYAKDREKSTIKPKTIWYGSKFDASSHGTMLIKSMFKESVFDYPKSIHAVADALWIATNTDSVVLDYFGGSGTTADAVINLNREHGGQRKFVLVESGDHFDTVLLPRVKKVVFSPDWKDGKSTRPATTEELQHSPRLVKYQRIESYEDALANIRFENDGLDFSSNVARYSLQWDTRESPTWLLDDEMEKPFDYCLELMASNGIHGDNTRIEHADLPETFAYLIGLRVRTRRIVMDGDRRYLVQRGIAAGKDTVVLWRDIADWEKEDYGREQQFIAESGLTKDAERILFNGSTAVKRGESLNPDFGRRMFSQA